MDYVWLYLSTWWTSARRIFIYFVCFDQVLAVLDTLNVVMLTLYNACVTHNNSVYGNCMKFQSTSHTVVFTSRACGRGNVFVVSVCLCVCVSVCLSVRAITFEAVDKETSFLVWWYILTISRSSLSIKVIGARSR